MMHLAKRMGTWTMAALAMACNTTTGGTTTGGTTTTTQSGGPGCSSVYCGDNAPTVGDDFIFDQLHLGVPHEGSVRYEPNHAGVRIAGTTIEVGKETIPVTLGVDRHWFYVKLPDGPRFLGRKLHGVELVNKKTVVTLENVRVNNQPKVQLLFADFSEGESVRFQVGDQEAVPVYRLMARTETDPPGEFERRVCNEKRPLGSDPHWSGEHAHHALVFRGDLYHPTEKRVLGEGDPRDPWFFLGCAGSAAAKMHLFRHTYAGSFKYGDPQVTQTPGPVADPEQLMDVPRPFNTSDQQRTALLKAITADYCGNGFAFTVAGQKLAFTTAKWFMPALPSQGMHEPQPPLRSLEAIWDHDGAICIEKPRRAQPGPGRDPLTGQKVPSAKLGWTPAEITAKCGRPIPACKRPLDLERWTSVRIDGRVPYAVTANP